MEAMREFRDMNPTTFDGMGDPLEAHYWLSGVRKALDTFHIREDEMRVSFASYQLVGEANKWWTSVIEAKKDARKMARIADSDTVNDELALISWDQFVSTFENHYFLESARDQLRMQFELLQ